MLSAIEALEPVQKTPPKSLDMQLALEKAGADGDTTFLFDEAEKNKTIANKKIAKKDYDAAIDFYTKAICCIDTNPVYYCNRAAAYTEKGLYAEAIGDCHRAAILSPDYVKAYLRLGRIYLQTNETTRAKNMYKIALEIEPGNKTASKAIAELGHGESAELGHGEKPADPMQQGIEALARNPGLVDTIKNMFSAEQINDLLGSNPELRNNVRKHLKKE
ncbi:MAG: TPR repeat protein [Amphiamblys sp. WSBS2006]|nr:MAG: TPR repeat protein [Amphiamblys sp. WSBS2006]